MAKQPESTTKPQPGRVMDLKPGTYCDGHPLDEVQYLECKLILKPDRFTSAKVFQESTKNLGILLFIAIGVVYIAQGVWAVATK